MTENDGGAAPERELGEVVTDYLRAKAADKRLAKTITDLGDELKRRLLTLDVPTASCPIGRVTVRSTSSTSLDRDKLAETLQSIGQSLVDYNVTKPTYSLGISEQ